MREHKSKIQKNVCHLSFKWLYQSTHIDYTDFSSFIVDHAWLMGIHGMTSKEKFTEN